MGHRIDGGRAFQAAAAALILCACVTAADDSPQILFNRVRQKVINSVTNAPRYTCIETVQRRTLIPKRSGRASCRNVGSNDADLTLASWDRLRLDVGIADGREVYSWHGERQFQDAPLYQMVGYGPTGSGMFYTFLGSIFGKAKGHYVFTGTVAENGHARALFKFAMAQRVSDYEIYSGRRRVIAGYSGEFRVDWPTADLLSLRIDSDRLPRDTGLCSIDIRSNYRQVPLGGSAFLLPEEVTTTMYQTSGIEEEMQTKYEDCRTFSGEATIHFTDASLASGAQANRSLKIENLPPGLLLRIRLASSVNLKSNWVGDPIDGTLEQPLHQKRSIIAAKGSRVEGRITRLQALKLPEPGMEVGIEWRRILTGSTTYNVSAHLLHEIDITRSPRDPNEHAPNYLVITGENPALNRGFVADWASERIDKGTAQEH